MESLFYGAEWEITGKVLGTDIGRRHWDTGLGVINGDFNPRLMLAYGSHSPWLPLVTMHFQPSDLWTVIHSH